MNQILAAARRALPAMLLACALAACGSPEQTYTAPIQENAPETLATSVAVPDAGSGQGIDQTKLDVCAMLPRAEVEGAIGALEEEPKQSIAIGSEVGCDYVGPQARSYEVSVYNLDRWDLIGQILDVKPVEGLGDGAYSEAQVGGGVALYVLLRDRAVVSVRVSGADTPALRKLLALAIDNVP